MLCALDDHRFSAEAVDGLCHLDSHRSTAEDEQSSWHCFHAGGLAARPDTIQLAKAGNRWNDWLGTGRENDVSCSVARAVHVHDAWSGETTMTAQQVDFVFSKPALLARVGIVGHYLVPPAECGIHINLRRCRGFVRAMRGLSWTEQSLGRDAGPVRAFA